jgi:hypothetical protein
MLPKLDESFKKAFIAWENQAADQWTALLRDPVFLKTIWKSIERTLAHQRSLSHTMQHNLDPLRVPTQEKQKQIDEQIEQLQRLVADLNERVDQLLRVMAEE